MPVVGTITMFLLPIPIILYTFKQGFKSSLVMFIVITLLSILLATVFSLPVTILAGLGGITIGLCLHYKKSVYETWAAGSVAFAVGFVIVFLISQLLFEVNFIDEMNVMVEQISTQTLNMLEQFGEVPEETVQLFEQQMNQITYLIPVMIGIAGIVYSFLAIWIGFKVLNRIYKKSYSFPPFRKFRLPISVVWYYFLSVVIMWIEPEQGTLLNQAASNVSMLVGLLLVLHGLSFIAHYVHVKNKSKGLFVTAIVLIVLLPTLFIYPIRILGIIDLGFNLRDRLSEEKK